MTGVEFSGLIDSFDEVLTQKKRIVLFILALHMT
jgi:hypothetical protein